MATTTEITAINLVNELAASSALTATVLDGEGGAVLHVDGTSWSYLVLTLATKTESAVTINSLASPVSSTNFNLKVDLGTGLYFGSNPANSLQLDQHSVNAGWQLAWGGGQYIDSLYLGCTASATVSEPTPLQINIQYYGAFPNDPAAVTTQVKVSYQNMVWNGSQIGYTLPPQQLRLDTKVGLPQPLIAQFIGPRTVLTDGTARTLCLRIMNTSADPVLFIAPPAGEKTQSGIEVILPVSDADADAAWALCKLDGTTGIKATLSGNASSGWSVTPNTTVAGAFTLTPDYATTTNIPAGGTLDLELQGVKSSLAPGLVQVLVRFRRFVLYGTQTIGVALEKTPLIYHDGLGSGMTLAAGSLGTNTGLALTGDSGSSLMTITQSGSGPALTANGDLIVSGQLTVYNGSIGVPAESPAGGSGTRLVLWPGAENTATPYALGINNYTLWYGVPNGSTHEWYIGTTPAMSLNQTNQTPELAVSGALSVTGGAKISGNDSGAALVIDGELRINGPSTQVQTPSLSLGGNGNFNIDAPCITAGRFVVQDGGNVGIGNANPSEKLEVNGNTILNGTLSVSNGLNAQAAQVAIMGKQQSLSFNPDLPPPMYVAPGDGFVFGQIWWNLSPSTPINTNVLGTVLCTIEGGSNTGAQSSCLMGMSCSILLPVAANQKFLIGVITNNADGSNAAPSNYPSNNFVWFPLGTGPAVPTTFS